MPCKKRHNKEDPKRRGLWFLLMRMILQQLYYTSTLQLTLNKSICHAILLPGGGWLTNTRPKAPGAGQSERGGGGPNGYIPTLGFTLRFGTSPSSIKALVQVLCLFGGGCHREDGQGKKWRKTLRKESTGYDKQGIRLETEEIEYERYIERDTLSYYSWLAIVLWFGMWLLW